MKSAFASLLLIALASCAASSPKPAETAAPKTRPLVLFRVEGKNGPSYILGTIHLVVTLDEALPASRRPLLDKASVVVAETDLAAALADPALFAQLSKKMWLPPGESLRAILGEELWFDAAGAPQTAALPWPLLDRLSPAALCMMLLMPASNSKVGKSGKAATPAVPLDVEVMRSARAAGTPLEFFETVDQQIELLMSAPREQMVAQIRMALTTKQTSGQVSGLIAAYRSGDPAAMSALVAGSGQDPYMDRMINGRTRAWLPRVDELVDRGGAFIAVGAAHVVGEQGLVALLREQGRTVVQLDAPVEALAVPAAAEEDTATKETASPKHRAKAHALTDPSVYGPYLKSDEARARIERNSTLLSTVLCRAGTPLLDCFSLAPEACVEQIHAAVPLCFEEHLAKHGVPNGSDTANADKGAGLCAASCLVVSGMAQGQMKDTPACQALTHPKAKPAQP